jgi:4-hydroxybenzoate polyprenyltransferase
MSKIAALYHSGLLSATALAGFFVQTSAALQGRFDPVPAIAFGLHIWVLYLVDRLVDAPEDAVARDTNCSAFVRQRRRLFLAMAVVACAALAALFALRPVLLIAFAAGTALCLGHFLRLPGLGKRIKDLPFAKAFHMPVASTAMILLYLGDGPGWSFHELGYLWVQFTTFHVGVAVYDLKDLTDDARAGIRTLPLALGVKRFVWLELAALAVAAAVCCGLVGEPRIAAAASVAAQIAGCVLLLRRPFGPGFCAYFDGVLCANLLGVLVIPS